MSFMNFNFMNFNFMNFNFNNKLYFLTFKLKIHYKFIWDKGRGSNRYDRENEWIPVVGRCEMSTFTLASRFSRKAITAFYTLKVKYF